MRCRRHWIALAMSVAACEPSFTGPDDRGPTVQISLGGPAAASTVYGDLTPALRAVRYVHLQFIREGSSRDTLVAGSFTDGAFNARVSLRAQEAGDWLEILAELRMENQLALFQGHSLILSHALAPRASMELVPVAAEIIADHVPTMSALGDTVTLGGHAIFANNVPIPGAVVTWQSGNSATVEVIDGGRAVSRANGSAFVTGSALGATLRRTVSVRQVPIAVTGLGPADTTIAVGATFQARPFGEDANGHPLLPGAAVQWAGRGVVTVDANGAVRGNAAGVGFVDMFFETVIHTAQVTVTP